MKNLMIGLFFCLLGLAASAEAQSNQPGQGNWFFQLNGDTSFPTARLSNEVNQGWGGEGSIGFRFPDVLSLSVESGYDTYSLKNTYNNFNSGSWNLVPLVFKAQVGFSNMPINPYVFVAGGLAFNTESFSGGGFTFNANETDFLGEAGVGFAFATMTNSSFFIQAKVEMDDTTSNYANDQPTYLFPINVGFQEGF